MATKPEGHELVIVPAGAGKSQLEVQLLADGTRTLPVFSSVARLVDEMGPHQAWVCLPMRAAAAAANRAAVDRVTLDPVLGRGAWPPRLPCAASTLRRFHPALLRPGDGRAWRGVS